MSEKNSFLEFYDGQGQFLENFNVWTVDNKIEERKMILNYPEGNSPLSGSADHIFPSPTTLPDLDELHFHMATITPEDGIRVVYSFIYRTKDQITMQNDVTVPAGTLVILALESRYLHPQCFQNILTQLFNHLSIPSFVIEEVLGIYVKPEIRRTLTSCELFCLPFNISQDSELGRFVHYIFSLLKVSDILYLTKVLLIGSPTILTAIDTQKLCFGCFSLLSLLYPLEWPNIFITAIPRHLIETVGSPVPYIIGVPFALMDDPAMEDSSAEVIVNLDFSHIDKKDPTVVEKKVSALDSEIESALQYELDLYKTTGAFPYARIQSIIWKYIWTIFVLSTGNQNANIKDPLLPLQICKDIENGSLNCPSKESNSFLKGISQSPVAMFFAENVIYKGRLDKMSEFALALQGIEKYLAIAKKVK